LTGQNNLIYGNWFNSIFFTTPAAWRKSVFNIRIKPFMCKIGALQHGSDLLFFDERDDASFNVL
jgi:hypothetical protein